jgi:membrane-associated phospholipid phosphatase
MGDAERIATELGSEPFVLLLGMLLLAMVALAVVATVTRWAARHARELFGRGERVWRWIERRRMVRGLEGRFPALGRALRELDPDEYLVMHAALGLAIAIAAIGFVGLAWLLFEGSALARLDQALASSLHVSASPQGVAAFRVFTFFGGGTGLTIVSALVALMLFARRRPMNRHLDAIAWLVAMMGVAVLNATLKLAFVRPRPVFEAPHAIAAGWSFPSGHAMATFVAAGMLAYFGVRAARRARLRACVLLAALVWTVAMGFSRLYLGVHYLSDVVGGFAAGTVWLSVCISAVEIARQRRASRSHPRGSIGPASS